MVYFILNKTQNAMKIGYAADYRRRFSELKTASPDELELFGVMMGTRADEASLKRRFKSHRIRREWFRIGPAFMDEVKALLTRKSASEEARVTEELLKLLYRHGPDVFHIHGPVGTGIDPQVKNLIRLVHAEGGFAAMRRVFNAVVAWATRNHGEKVANQVLANLNWRFDSVGEWYA